MISYLFYSDHFSLLLQVSPLQQLSLANTLACKFCGKPFRSEQGLRDHENAHKGKFRYNCPHCQRGFVAINHYKEHLTGHTGVGYFTCRLCGEKLASQYQMKIHKNREHPDDGERAIVLRGGINAVEMTNREAGGLAAPISPTSAPATPSASTSTMASQETNPMLLGSPDMSYGELVATQILAKAGFTQKQPLVNPSVAKQMVANPSEPGYDEPAEAETDTRKDVSKDVFEKTAETEQTSDDGSDSDT